MGDRNALLVQAELLLKEAKFFDGLQRINTCFELIEPEIREGAGAKLRILKEPDAFLAEVMPRLTSEQKAFLCRMYETRGDLVAGLGATKRAFIEYGCCEALMPDDERIKAKKAKLLGAGDDEEKEEERVPVTVLTGFLGSGKTTLLNHILEANHGKKIAVIENEFGEVSIDDALVKGGNIVDEENIVTMNNGCICCNVRGDLIAGLKKLIKVSKKSGKPLDGVIIETTGLADPAPVAQTFFAEDFVQKHMRLDGILTMVDAKHIIPHLDEVKLNGVVNEAIEQVAFADRILLNKCDLVDEAQLAEVDRRIRLINKVAPVQRTTNSQVDMSFVIGIRGFSLERIMEMDTNFFEGDGDGGASADGHGDGHGGGGGDAHGGGHGSFEPVAKAPGHQHDSRVSSVGFDVPGELDYGKLNEWIGKLLKEKGADIYRSKGVLAVKGLREKYVFQAIHMVFTGLPQKPWAEGEQRRCKLVFIGRDLNREELHRGFMLCMVKA